MKKTSNQVKPNNIHRIMKSVLQTILVIIVICVAGGVGLVFAFDPPRIVKEFIESSIKSKSAQVITTNPSPTSQPTPKPNSTTIPKTTTNSSQITCIGPDDKQFKTTMTECKAMNDKWNHPLDYMTNCNIHADCGGGTVYIAKSECDKPCAGRKTNTINPAPSTYPPCTVYYSALGTSQTYLNILPMQCLQWQNNAKSTTTLYTPSPTYTPMPTPTPNPTTDPAFCSQALNMWLEYVADFNANKYNTYSSSTEAMMALLADKEVFQNQIYSYGCDTKL